MFRRHTFSELFAPETVAGNTGNTSQPDLSIEDLLNADDPADENTAGEDEIDPSLTGIEDESDEDDSEEPKEDSEEASEDNEEDEEEKPKKPEEEPEEELKLEDDEDLDIAKIPTRAQIKAKYPNIFKEFKFLDKVIYRETEFAKVFPTIADAKQASQTVSNYKEFQDDLLSGNVENVLRSVKKVNEQAFTKIASGLMDSLTRIDPNAHVHVTAQVTKGILNQLNSIAKKTLTENPESKEAQQLEIATEIIHNAIWNTRKVTPFQKVEDQPESAEVKQLREERNSDSNRRFNSALDVVADDTESFTKKVIEANVDTKNMLPAYVRAKLGEDILVEVKRQLNGDERFVSFMRRHWDKARQNNLNDQSLNTIKTALKNHVKSLLPGIIKAKKGEAIKGLTTKKVVTRELPKKQNGNGASRSDKPITSNRRESDRLVPREGESPADFLMRD